MLLFSDGFEYFHPKDLYRKWGYTWLSNVITDESQKPLVVFGEDDNFDPPYNKYARKGGKALMFQAGYCAITKLFRKSRAVYLGFAFRRSGSRSANFSIRFHTRGHPYNYPVALENEPWNDMYEVYPSFHPTIATCTFLFRDGGEYIDYKWDFTDEDAPTRYNQVFSHRNLLSGDWSYHEIGMTIHGNLESGAQAWVENRIGSNNSSRLENIYTASPTGMNCHFIDGITLDMPNTVRDLNLSFDDLYICNDEGNVNNSFLGPIIIRSTLPNAKGSYCESVLNGTEGNDPVQAVKSQYVNTHDQLPTPMPTPEEDPLFVEWADPRASYLTLPTEGNRQTFGVRAASFDGSEPAIYALALYSLFRPQHDTIGNTTIRPYLFNGNLSKTIEGEPFYRPLKRFPYDEWEARELIFENPDIEQSKRGNPPDLFNTLDINEHNEFGFQLCRIDPDIESFNPSVLRNKYTFDILAEETLSAMDFPHRFFEEQVAQSINLSDDSGEQKVFPIYEGLQINEEFAHAARGRYIYVGSAFKIAVNIPWFILYLHENIDFKDKLSWDWLSVIQEGLNTDDFAYDQWVELLESLVEATSYSAPVLEMKADETFAVSESDLQTNHELLIEPLNIREDYVWSGHEWLGETLYPEDEAPIWGWKVPTLGEYINVVEDHFDGNWVQLDDHQFSVTDHILTQHWRHEFVLGYCVRSWQVEPIEQEGDDGDRSGQLTSQYWEMIGYESDPFAD